MSEQIGVVAALENPKKVVPENRPANDIDEKEGKTRPEGLNKMPSSCPVVPLGQSSDGSSFFYKTASDLMRRLPASEHGRLNLISLFSPNSDWLYQNFPVWVREKGGERWIRKPNAFSAEQLQDLLMDDAAKCGVWNPEEKTRGVGCWVDDDGGLVVHRGKNITIYPLSGEPKQYKPGMIGKYFYPANENLGDEILNGNDVGSELHKIIQAFTWANAEIDPRLFVGWIGGAMLGGALPWRPMMWVTGASGSGKSSLQAFVKALFGGGIHSFENATAAGIRQLVANTTLPIAIDELENSGDNRKAEAIIEQMRLASSGGSMARGGQDHKAHTFTARSSYLVSSIRTPPLHGQDNSRITALRLERLDHEGKMVLPSANDLRELGLRALGKLIKRWAAFRPAYEKWWAVLRGAGADDRHCDQLGTLLAISDMLLLDDEALNAPIIDGITDSLRGILTEQKESFVPDWKDWLQHLCGSQPTRTAASMRVQTIGEMVRRVIKSDKTDVDLSTVIDELSRIGLKLWKDKSGKKYILVAHRTPALIVLHENSSWSGAAGAVSSGWTQAAKTAPDSITVEAKRFGGAKCRAVALPIDCVLEVIGGSDE